MIWIEWSHQNSDVKIIDLEQTIGGVITLSNHGVNMKRCEDDHKSFLSLFGTISTARS